MNWPHPMRWPSYFVWRFVYQSDESTDVPSGLKTLIWWLS